VAVIVGLGVDSDGDDTVEVTDATDAVKLDAR